MGAIIGLTAHALSGVLALAAKDGRLFAVTGDEIVVLSLGERLEVVSRAGLGPALESAGVERAEPSGLAVGEEYLYVTLEDEPYVLLVGKKWAGKEQG